MQYSQESTCARASFLIKKTLTEVFYCELCEFLSPPFLQNSPGRLLLIIVSLMGKRQHFERKFGEWIFRNNFDSEKAHVYLILTYKKYFKRFLLSYKEDSDFGYYKNWRNCPTLGFHPRVQTQGHTPGYRSHFFSMSCRSTLIGILF